MNENLLNALVELIALFARVNKTRFIDNAHSLLKTYLEQTLQGNNGRNHIRKFYDYLDFYSASLTEISIDEFSVKKNIIEIAKKINSELNEEERMILFLSFLELIKLDAKIEATELGFVELLYSELHISTNDYKNSLLFILCNDSEINNEVNNSFLVITNASKNNLDELEGTWIEQNRPIEEDKNLCLINNEIEGSFLILRLSGTTFLAGRYFGNQLCFLNNRKIYPGKFFIINQFDILKISPNVKFSFQEIMTGFKLNNPHATLKLVGDNVSTSNKAKRIKFNPFSFSEELGNIAVILCNDSNESNNIVHLLTGQLPLATGKICLNGYNIYSERYRVHKMIGLVPIESLFDPNISIFHNLWFSARLSFPTYSESRVNLLVEQTLNSLGLQKIRNIPIKNIKGFLSIEFLKILINIGIEIIRDPLVLVLDLPFEKLNASNAEELCQILKNESIKGKLIFLTTINPRTCILKKTDRLWIFDTYGYMIYRGPANSALSYFRNAQHNISSVDDLCPFCGSINADQLYQIFHAKIIDVHGKPTHERKTNPQEWYKIYKEEIEGKEFKSESSKMIPSFASSIPNVNIQFFSYLKKSVLSFLANPLKQTVFLNFGWILSICIAGLLRYDWTDKFEFSKHEHLPLLFFLNTIVCFIIGAIGGLQTTMEEKNRIAHDHFKNYSYFSYLNVKYILLVIHASFFSLIFTTLTNSITGINGLFLSHWLIYLSITFIGGCFGLFVGGINIRFRYSLIVLMLFLSLNVIFSGYIVPFNNLPRQIASDKYVPAFVEIFPSRWAYEALVVQQAINNNFEKSFFKTEQKLSDLTFKTNIIIPQLQEKLFYIQNHASETIKLSLFYKELTEINKEYPEIFQFEFLQELTKPKISIEVLSELEDYLRYVQFQLYEKLKDYLSFRNELKKIVRDSIGKNNYDKFLNKNYNLQIAQYVSGKKSGKNYINTENDIIQIDNPIFRLPDNNFGRAHFLAPQKLMNGYYYDTSFFNLFILWFEIFFLYLATLIFRKKSIL